jgi:hypothetical protein
VADIIVVLAGAQARSEATPQLPKDQKIRVISVGYRKYLKSGIGYQWVTSGAK